MVSPRFWTAYPHESFQEVFRPNRCACTYGELDHFGFAQLLQVGLWCKSSTDWRGSSFISHHFPMSKFLDPKDLRKMCMRISGTCTIHLLSLSESACQVGYYLPSRRPPWALATASWMWGVALESWWWLLPASRLRSPVMGWKSALSGGLGLGETRRSTCSWQDIYKMLWIDPET